MDLDFAHSMVTGGKKAKENPNACSSPSSAAYQQRLAEAFNMNRTRILTFKNKPPISIEPIPRSFLSPVKDQPKTVKPQRFIPQVYLITLNQINAGFEHAVCYHKVED